MRSRGEASEKPFADGFAALKSLDADHDGETDAGELKTLNGLGITSIDLAPTVQSGLVNGGNEVLASASFVQGDVTKEAQAARFIANPVGNTASVGTNGTMLSAEDGQSTYVSTLASGETLDVALLGVSNAGNTGDDVLIGDAGDNLLVGGFQRGQRRSPRARRPAVPLSTDAPIRSAFSWCHRPMCHEHYKAFVMYMTIQYSAT